MEASRDSAAAGMSGYFLYHSIGTFPGKEDALRDERSRGTRYE